ncbi:putative RiPP precursor [Kaistia adipata]|nr:putative RiPP precursor [Kaistia adipata]
MKKTYEKPALEKRALVQAIAAAPGSGGNET